MEIAGVFKAGEARLTVIHIFHKRWRLLITQAQRIAHVKVGLGYHIQRIHALFIGKQADLCGEGVG